MIQKEKILFEGLQEIRAIVGELADDPATRLIAARLESAVEVVVDCVISEIGQKERRRTMQTKTVAADVIPSLIPSVDETWGGYRRGGSYLVHGVSGREQIGLKFIEAGVEAGEATLIVCGNRASTLQIEAEAAGFRMRDAIDCGRLHLVRLPQMSDLRSMGDGGIERLVHDVLRTVREKRIERVLFTDFATYAWNTSYGFFCGMFVELLDHFETTGTTTLFVLPELEDELTHAMEFMAQYVAGVIQVVFDDASGDARTLVLTSHSADDPVRVVTMHMSDRDRMIPKLESFDFDYDVPATRAGQAASSHSALIGLGSPSDDPSEPIALGSRSDFASLLQEFLLREMVRGDHFEMVAIRIKPELLESIFPLEVLGRLLVALCDDYDAVYVCDRSNSIIVLLRGSDRDRAAYVAGAAEQRITSDFHPDDSQGAPYSISLYRDHQFQNAEEYLTHLIGEG